MDVLGEYMRIKHHWSCVRAGDFFFNVFLQGRVFLGFVGQNAEGGEILDDQESGYCVCAFMWYNKRVLYLLFNRTVPAGGA